MEGDTYGLLGEAIARAVSAAEIRCSTCPFVSEELKAARAEQLSEAASALVDAWCRMGVGAPIRPGE